MATLNSYKNFLWFVRGRRDAAAIVAQLATLAGERLDSAKPLSADSEESNIENEIKPMLGKTTDGTEFLWPNERLRKLYVAVQSDFPKFLLDLTSEKYKAAEAAAKADGA